MKTIYTPLEDFIKTLYNQLSITQPQQLKMLDIASKLNISIHFHDGMSAAISHKKEQFIFLNNKITQEEQWEIFGHELGHILMHAGNQLYLPKSYIQFQEYKAQNFALHFCIPGFMLEAIPLRYRKEEMVQAIAASFGVTELTAKKRYEHWFRQRENEYIQMKVKESIHWPIVDIDQ
ncbi:ImmA/IrrE family metallo-endopeptidase [Jeotgalibacillus soli]|uniref:IrrE N-terminal-like domain-containing protein n=1 Tax=Jeotgalibacillus soli TaxID=889306 RepID=A0A0C2QX31_9BACL|nr:ImmA/IrrE family metallo-endopeptidase [Jeotgalibacillus soli]KIL42630.1 hypothetical protein KP78_38530 [Jeotgalibacillus soli]